MEYEFRTQDTGNARAEGNDDDYNRIVGGLRRGLSYWDACARLAIPIKRDFLEKIQPTMEKWAKEGRPKPAGLMAPAAPAPIDHIVKEGKIFAIFADGTAREVNVITPKK